MPSFQSVLDYVDQVIEEEMVAEVIAAAAGGDCVDGVPECGHGADEGNASSDSGGANGWL